MPRELTFDAKSVRLNYLDYGSNSDRGEARLGAVMTDDEISWLQASFGNVQCVRIDGVGHLLHLQDEGQTPVLNAMRALLEGV